MVDLSSATTSVGCWDNPCLINSTTTLAPIGSLFERSPAKGTDPLLECRGSAVIAGLLTRTPGKGINRPTPEQTRQPEPLDLQMTSVK